MKRFLMLAGVMLLGGLALGLARRQERRSLPALEVLPAGGGQSIVHGFCQEALGQGLLTGNSAFCLDGDGPQWSDGGTNLVAVGSPLTVSTVACPSGPNCTTRSAQYLDGGQPDGGGFHFETGNVASPAGDFSVCAFINEASFNPDYGAQVVQKDSTTERVFGLYSGTTSAATNFIVFANSGNSSASGPTVGSRRRLLCGTYDYVTDGTSVLTAYINGTAGTPVTTGKGPPKSYSSNIWVGGREYTGAEAFLNGGIEGAFLTEQTLSAVQISSLDSAVLGTLSGSRGEAITTTRNSLATCANEDESALQTLPANKGCVRKGGLQSEPAATNLLLRSEEFDTTWSTAGSTVGATITPNAGVAPDGTLTADRIQLPAVSGTSRETITQGITATAAAHTFSLWLKGWSGSGSVYISSWVAATGASCVKTLCSYNATTWTRCGVTGTKTAAAWTDAIGAWKAVVDCNHSDTDAADFLVWGAQEEVGAYASSYIRTEGSTATRVASYTTVASPLAGIPTGASTAYCMGATWVPPVGATAWSQMGDGVAIAAIGGSYAGANEAFLYVNASDGKGVLDTRDATASNKTRSTSAALSFASHRIVGCNDTGTFQVWVDGVPVAMAAAAGAGTGLITTMPSTHDVGSLNTGATGYQAKGIVKDVCVGPIGSCQ